MNNTQVVRGVMAKIVANLNRNFIFRYISSIRLAVPLMIGLSVIVAYGTVVESQYNAEYSGMLIYRSEWFGLLLILFFINILAATISRYPFLKHHTGFVITHIGLLLVLAGSFFTNQWGIDGQMAIEEGGSNSEVILPHLSLSVSTGQVGSSAVFDISKGIKKRDSTDFTGLNQRLDPFVKILAYVPFAQKDDGFVRGIKELSSDSPVAISFSLKSNFFNVSQWLDSEEQSEMQMGPATLRLRKSDKALVPLKPNYKPLKLNSPKLKIAKSKSNDVLVVTNSSDEGVLLEKPISELQKNGEFSIGKINVKINKIYLRAMVAGNKIQEGEEGALNPAIELLITKDGDSKKEIVYQKFANFSLHPDGVFGLRFKYGGEPPTNTGEITIAHGGMGMSPQGGGSNIVEFVINPVESSQVLVNLYKANEVVQSSIVKEGETLQTPWMGMRITLGQLILAAQRQMEIQEINPVKAQQLPPSALLVESAGERAWLLEEEEHVFGASSGQSIRVRFGRERVVLPFRLNLHKFSKVDYPGTGTAMSFESEVTVDQSQQLEKISMNEPLKRAGYTVYQASYVLNQGAPPVSIFSVNQDPGRAIKYLGSLILSLGIIIFTRMRSSWWKNRESKKNLEAKT